MVFYRVPNADFNTLLFRLCQAYVYYFCSFIVKRSFIYLFVYFGCDVISCSEQG